MRTNQAFAAENIHAGVGAGRNRQPWRIREWLDANNLNMSDIAREAGVQHSTASRTIRGIANSRPVLRALYSKGCPSEYLSLPHDLLQELAKG